MSKEIWTDEDELGFQIGDMNGEWQTQESKAGGGKFRIEKPLRSGQKRKSVQVIRQPITENQKNEK